VSLSRTEFIMLYTLAQMPGSIVPHHVLLEACWQEDVPALSAVDATVYRLRKKLSHAPGGKELVKTVRGQGYALRRVTN
jgi:DNA-binding response OmpR family regulator